MPRRTDLHSICLIGSGPIVIGQACEFDYAGCQALKVLREDGFRTIVVNSNPATIMTDPGFADRTYLEPLDLARRDHPREANRQRLHRARIDHLLELRAAHAESSRRLADREHSDAGTMRGPWAGARIVVLGGRCAERSGHVR